MKPSIAVYGYCVNDNIRRTGGKVEVRTGGAVHFITKALSNLERNISGVLKGKSSPLEVSFDESDDNAVVRLKCPSNFSMYSEQEVVQNLDDAALVIVSPVIDEFPIELLSRIRSGNKLFIAIDLQGFQRRVSEGIFSRDRAAEEVIQFADIIKCTLNELNRQGESLASVSKYTDKIFLISNGRKGITLVSGGREQTFPTEVLDVDTVGAGDTLFASFCHFYLETKQAAKSAKMAQDYVINWLKSRLSQASAA